MTQPLRMLVTGGRMYSNRAFLYGCLDEIHRDCTIQVLIHGGAGGADRMASDWALDRRVLQIGIDAYWRKLAGLAGPERNQRMLTEARPNVCVAFLGGKGTFDMIERATRAGIPVLRTWELRADTHFTSAVAASSLGGRLYGPRS